MWVWGFVAHHKTAAGCGCVFWLQRASAPDSVWATRFSPQEQHDSMLKPPPCECETMYQLTFFITRTNNPIRSDKQAIFWATDKVVL